MVAAATDDEVCGRLAALAARAGGRPVPLDRVAEALGAPPAVVLASLERLRQEGRAYAARGGWTVRGLPVRA